MVPDDNRLCEYDSILKLTLLEAGTEATMQLLKEAGFSSVYFICLAPLENNEQLLLTCLLFSFFTK